MFRVKNKTNLAIPLVVAVFLAGALVFGTFSVWKDRVGDLLFSTNQKSERILIVEIDEVSLQKIGQWPWPRVVFAQAINQLKGAEVIGIDVNFKESSRLGQADDSAFARAIANSTVPVVLSASLDAQGRLEGPIGALVEVSRVGYTNLVTSPDGLVRRVQLAQGEQDSFGLLIAQAEGQNSPVPDSYRNSSERINYNQKDSDFSKVSFVDLVQGNIPTSFFEGKTVLIGATAADLQDFHQTPFGVASGVSIQAQIVEMISRGQFIREVSVSMNLLLVLLFSFGSALIIFYLKRGDWRLGLLVILFGFYNLYSLFIFDAGLLADIFHPNLAIILSSLGSFGFRYLEASRQRRFLTDSFSRYVAPEIVKELLESPEKLKLGGQNRRVTILFSDIRGFTTLSESLSPEKLVEFLNRYLTVMTDIVLGNKGVIDKYIGDAVMAFWGAPLENKNHAGWGVISAIKMIESLNLFNQESARLGSPEIKIGVGLNTGEVTVGNLGSERRFDYTVIGDTVNSASRLESLTKMYGAQIIIGQETLKEIAQNKFDSIIGEVTIEGHGEKVLIRELDTVKVKGKEQGLKIYEVILGADEKKINMIKEDFKRALLAYYRGDWAVAKSALRLILEKHPEDGPTKLLLARCQELEGQADWHGIYTLTSK
ncbi:MAG: hypothetical protein COV31_00395 [Candidatus Yanofskybacteria bacterium CG10_big_fil_rev_8_21_14_0_10_46_23]|uniref:Guanylate cyclase domain-containing protein n=1 Tax=Candidatus Yanofskybacteria bacterium CG10_big_fil_rev_8_21_14_0_10_46_23 TaxID=1975098 RepID=A0A2H0R6V1_9BACT|nr:MAG: hypothetical protein COV31_00395 [Candidatus Yanofskybacteria bacterium CG10_big_fil_rev_8_21_14_0_10_46_23]